jgi:hypothetical protein
MADEKRAPTAIPLASFRTILTLFFALLLLPICVGQNAGARRDFVKRLGQSTIVKTKGSELVPAYKISTDGPDSTSFVYHASLMNPSICGRLLNEHLVSKFRALGFTKLVCTDDGDDTFSFDPIVQNVSPVAARKDFVEMVRRSVIKRLGAQTPAGYNLSADGLEATTYVHHQSVVDLADCNRLLEDKFISGLRGHGFVSLVCTDDRSLTFLFDLSSHSGGTAFALLEPPE